MNAKKALALAKRKDTKTTSIRMSVELKNELDEMRKKLGVSQTDFVVIALTETIQRIKKA